MFSAIERREFLFLCVNHKIQIEVGETWQGEYWPGKLGSRTHQESLSLLLHHISMEVVGSRNELNDVTMARL